MAFGEQGAAGVQGFVAAAGVGVTDDRVHDDRVAVGVQASGVAAQDDRQARQAEMPTPRRVQTS